MTYRGIFNFLPSTISISCQQQ